MQLIKMSYFFSQFSLNIYYKPKRFNVFSNLLSRFFSYNTLAKIIGSKFNKHDTFYAYNISIEKIDEFLIIKICKKYINDPTWKKIKKILKANCFLGLNIANLIFEFRYP